MILQPKISSQEVHHTQLHAKIVTFCRKDFQNMEVNR